MEKGKGICVRLLEVSDAENLLALESNNREFFQLYRPLKDEGFYTIVGQLERIKKSEEQAKMDASYSFGFFLAEGKHLIGNVTLSEVARGDYQSCWIGYYLDTSREPSWLQS